MTDVLVVGGGPVGVSMGLLCAHRGLSVVIVERATEVYDLPRAIVMDDEIQRVFQGIGLMDRLAAVTTTLKGAEFLAADGTQIIGLEIPAHVRPYGHPLTVCDYQPELEALLRKAAVEAGVRLLLGNTVEHVDEHDGGVTAEVIGPAGEVTELDARWLVAADGAASPIRKRLGLRFDDLGFDQDWLVIDTELAEPADGVEPASVPCEGGHPPGAGVGSDVRASGWCGHRPTGSVRRRSSHRQRQSGDCHRAPAHRCKQTSRLISSPISVARGHVAGVPTGM